MVEITLPVVLQIVQTVGILVGIIYYFFIMRNSQRNQQMQLETRQAQLFMQSYQKTATVELQTLAFEILEWEWTDYADFVEKYVKDTRKYGEWVSFMLHINGIGILLKEKYIDSELLYKMDQDGVAPMMWWYKFESVIREMREQMNNPDLMKYFEYYVKEMSRLRRLKGLPSKWSTEQERLLNE